MSRNALPTPSEIGKPVSQLRAHPLKREGWGYFFRKPGPENHESVSDLFSADVQW